MIVSFIENKYFQIFLKYFIRLSDHMLICHYKEKIFFKYFLIFVEIKGDLKFCISLFIPTSQWRDFELMLIGAQRYYIFFDCANLVGKGWRISCIKYFTMAGNNIQVCVFLFVLVAYFKN